MLIPNNPIAVRMAIIKTDIHFANPSRLEAKTITITPIKISNFKNVLIFIAI